MTGKRESMADFLAKRQKDVAAEAAKVAPVPGTGQDAPPEQPAASKPQAVARRAQPPGRRAVTAVPPLPAQPPRPKRAGKQMRPLLIAARVSARSEPRAWEPYTVRLPDALARRLAHRTAADKQATGDLVLAMSHYLNAALALVPADPQAAAVWGVAWRKRQGEAIVRTPTRGTGRQLHRDVAAKMHNLTSWLPTLEDPRPAKWEVEAEALTRFLDAMDAEPAVPEDAPAPVTGLPAGKPRRTAAARVPPGPAK